MKRLGLLLMPLAWSAVHAQGVPPINYDTDTFLGNPVVQFNLDDAGTTLREGVSGALYTAAGAGTTQFRQPGFNLFAPANFSALFAYNSKSVSPNFTQGDFNWTQPFTMVAHLRNLNVTRSNFTRSEIASKGPMGANLVPADLTSKGWDFFLHWNGSATRACVLLSGSASITPSPVSTGFESCGNVDLLNGVDHDIVVSYNGSGTAAGLSWVVDNNPVVNALESGGQSFGHADFTITNGGTGYANPTAFTSTGGGTFCVVSGTLPAPGGVLTTSGASVPTDSGCTSPPMIVLTAPTGIGATFTTSVITSSTSTSTTSPLTIAGNVSDSIANAGSNIHNAAGIQIDESAIYPTVLSSSSPLPYQLFADAVGWQQFVTVSSNPPLFIHDNDGCQDVDNAWAVDTLIRMHQRNVIRLIDLNNTVTVTTDSQTYRSMLDRAGLNHIPMSVSTVPFNATSGNCNNIGTYSGSVASQASYPVDVTAMRTALVNAPNTSVTYTLGGSYASLDALLQSAADSISPLTGSQLVAAKVSGIYMQVGYFGSPISSDNNINENFAAAQRVYNVLATLGVPYFLAGTSAGTFQVPSNGPTRYSTSPTDPFGLWLNAFFAATGQDTRSGWDGVAAMASLVPSYFTNQQGTFILTGTAGSWTGTLTPGTGTGFYQIINSQANANALGVITNSLTGSNPVPHPANRL